MASPPRKQGFSYLLGLFVAVSNRMNVQLAIVENYNGLQRSLTSLGTGDYIFHI
jgi:hypothetical protein